MATGTAVPRTPKTASRAAAGRGRRAARFALVSSSPIKRIEAVRRGFAADSVAELAELLGWSREHAMSVLNLKRSTVNRKLRTNVPLDVAESERVLSLQDLVGQVEQMVQRAGTPEGFDAGQWLGQWLDAPVSALGDRPPAEFLDTNDGARLVAQLLAQMETGAYA